MAMIIDGISKQVGPRIDTIYLHTYVLQLRWKSCTYGEVDEQLIAGTNKPTTRRRTDIKM